MAETLVAWRTAKRPPDPEQARRWLQTGAAGAAQPPASAAAAAAATAAPAAPATLARLIAAPHQPRARWGAFAGGSSAPSAAAPEAPAQWGQASFGAAPTTWRHSGGGAPSSGWAGRQPGAASAWSGGGQRSGTGGYQQQQQQQQQQVWQQLEAPPPADDVSLRAASNSPPATFRPAGGVASQESSGRQPTVYPLGIHSFQPSSLPQAQRVQHPPAAQHPHWQAPAPAPQVPPDLLLHARRQQQQQQYGRPLQPPAQQQQQQQPMLSGARAEPSASQLSEFVQQHGLQSQPLDAVVQAWHARQQAQPAAWGQQAPQQHWQAQPWVPPPQQWEQQPEQQAYEGPFPQWQVKQQQQPPPQGKEQQQPPQQLQWHMERLQPGEERQPPKKQKAAQKREQAQQAAAPAAAATAPAVPLGRKLRQAMISAGGALAVPDLEAPAAPADVPSPWTNPGRDGGATGGKKKGKKAAAGDKGAAKPAAKVAARPALNHAQAAVAAAAGAVAPPGEDYSDASDFEDGPPAAAAAAAPLAKRPKKAQAAAAPAQKAAGRAAGKAGGKSGRAAKAAEEAVAEALDVGPWAGVTDAACPLGLSRLSAEMDKAVSCAVGLLLVDPTGTQFFSTLEPLSKQQQQRAKAAAAAAAAAAAGGGWPAKKRASGKGKAAAAAGDEAAGAAAAAAPKPAAAAAKPSVVGLCALPIRLNQQGRGVPSSCLFWVPLVQGTWGGVQVGPDAAAQGRSLAQQLVAGPNIVAFHMQDLLRLLPTAGVAVPRPHDVALIDPRLLCWLLEPQLLQGSDKELSDYSLAELAERHLGGMMSTAPAGDASPDAGAAAGGGGGSSSSEGAPAPLQRMRRALVSAVALGERIHPLLLEASLLGEAIQLEMQMAALLAEMEGTGLGFDPFLLGETGRLAQEHMARIKAGAEELAGRAVNLASPLQLAEVLYTVLKLPPPAAHGRSAAKTHLPTDENALNQLKPLSPLPGLVLEFRALSNFSSKFVEADWAKGAAGGCASAAAYAATHPAAPTPRVQCSWNQTATATGRLSSSAPNLQAVTKYQLEAAGTPGLINIRDAFTAPPGCVLIAADYSQVELRVLAHLCGDPALVGLLRQAGSGGADAFDLIASQWLGSGSPEHVSKADREKAKRVTYGIIYGLTAYGLAQGSGALGISVQAGQELIHSFLSYFKGVAAWIERTKAAARQHGGVATLAGRRRPIKGLTSTDKKERAEAERKAINTSVQGSAADLMKQAMVGFSRWLAATWPQHAGPAAALPVRIVAQIHDELLVEVDASQVDVRWVAAQLRDIMEGVGSGLAVPLTLKMKAGERWGSMSAME